MLKGSTEVVGRRLDFRALQSRVQSAIRRGTATGLAVAVVEGGRILWEEGFGWADREAKLTATPKTPFSMASITKPFTSTTLMTLISEGKLSLDDSANRYMEEGGIGGSNGNPDLATVRMLGAHISGLPSMYKSYEADQVKTIPNPSRLLREYGRLAYPPGCCYEYSNIGYAALNAIALSITQKEFGKLMQEKLLTPLGLRDSFFETEGTRWQVGAKRYSPLGQLITHYKTSTPASGELYASAHDLAQFLLFNMRPPRKDTGNVLSARYISELHKPVFRGPSGIASTFGWFTGETASGVSFVFKTGGDPGVANRICFVPSKGDLTHDTRLTLVKAVKPKSLVGR